MLVRFTAIFPFSPLSLPCVVPNAVFQIISCVSCGVGADVVTHFHTLYQCTLEDRSSCMTSPVSLHSDRPVRTSRLSICTYVTYEAQVTRHNTAVEPATNSTWWIASSTCVLLWWETRHIEKLTFTQLSSVLWRTSAVTSRGVLCSIIHTVLWHTA